MRMSRAERRERLLDVLYAAHEGCTSQAEFSADTLAARAGVSKVHFYNLVGKEFSELRATLPGPRRPSRNVISRLYRIIKELRNELQTLRARYETAIKEKIAEAIRHIELLDQENRMLRDKILILEQRLDEGTTVIGMEPRSPTEAQELYSNQI
jgi:AraC-like DNA-binding protein